MGTLSIATSQRFQRRIRRAWGDPVEVALIGISDVIRRRNQLRLNEQQQVKVARKIATLAGNTLGQDPETFIEKHTHLEAKLVNRKRRPRTIRIATRAA